MRQWTLLVCTLAVAVGPVGVRPAVAQLPLTRVALSGTPAPAGGTYGGFDPPRVNGAGQVAFRASLSGGSSTTGIFVGAPGAIQAAALSGTPAPAGGTYDTFGVPSLNNAGQVGIRASLTGGSSTAGIFMGAPGAVQAVALQGTAAPAGGNYSDFPVTPTISGLGRVAFFANLTGGTATAGLFVGTPGALQAVALQGTPAPGGGNFSDAITIIPA